MKYRVLRQHFSDKLYTEGQERECDDATAKILIKQGLIEEIKPQEAPKNKAKQPHKTK